MDLTISMLRCHRKTIEDHHGNIYGFLYLSSCIVYSVHHACPFRATRCKESLSVFKIDSIDYNKVGGMKQNIAICLHL